MAANGATVTEHAVYKDFEISGRPGNRVEIT